MSEYLVSVIIPTRNRQYYCNFAVRQILSLKQDIQIIVQDNSDDDSLKGLLNDILSLDCITYNYIDYKIAGIDNYNVAAKNAEGEFFIAIGDDDAILPNISECAQWMKRNSIDGVLPSKKISYFWPDPNSDDRTKQNGKLRAYNYSGKIKDINSHESVVRLLQNGGQDYLDLSMIGSYHCLVRTDCMKEIMNLTGRYYGGLSPDMYSAICLSLLENRRYVEIDYPISLPGVCPQSTSADSDKGKHVGKLETAPHFLGLQEDYTWNDLIPRYYSVQTIWAETMIHSILKMGCKDLIDRYFNRTVLVNRLLKDNNEHQDDIMNVLSEDDKSLISDSENIYKYKKSKMRVAVLNIYHTLRRLELRNNNCSNIVDAVYTINAYLGKRYHKNRWQSIINTTL